MVHATTFPQQREQTSKSAARAVGRCVVTSSCALSRADPTCVSCLFHQQRGFSSLTPCHRLTQKTNTLANNPKHACRHPRDNPRALPKRTNACQFDSVSLNSQGGLRVVMFVFHYTLVLMNNRRVLGRLLSPRSVAFYDTCVLGVDFDVAEKRSPL